MCDASTFTSSCIRRGRKPQGEDATSCMPCSCPVSVQGKLSGHRDFPSGDRAAKMLLQGAPFALPPSARLHPCLSVAPSTAQQRQGEELPQEPCSPGVEKPHLSPRSQPVPEKPLPGGFASPWSEVRVENQGQKPCESTEHASAACAAVPRAALGGTGGGQAKDPQMLRSEVLAKLGMKRLCPSPALISDLPLVSGQQHRERAGAELGSVAPGGVWDLPLCSGFTSQT